MRISLKYKPNEIIKAGEEPIGCSVYINNKYFNTYSDVNVALVELLNNGYIDEEIHKRFINHIRLREIEGDFK